MKAGPFIGNIATVAEYLTLLDKIHDHNSRQGVFEVLNDFEIVMYDGITYFVVYAYFHPELMSYWYSGNIDLFDGLMTNRLPEGFCAHLRRFTEPYRVVIELLQEMSMSGETDIIRQYKTLLRASLVNVPIDFSAIAKFLV